MGKPRSQGNPCSEECTYLAFSASKQECLLGGLGRDRNEWLRLCRYEHFSVTAPWIDEPVEVYVGSSIEY